MSVSGKTVLRLILAVCFIANAVFCAVDHLSNSGGVDAEDNSVITDYYQYDLAADDNSENSRQPSTDTQMKDRMEEVVGYYPMVLTDAKNKRAPWFYPLRSINRRVFNQVDADLGKRTNDGSHFDNYDNMVGIDYRDNNGGRRTFNDYGNAPPVGSGFTGRGSLSSGHGLSSTIGRNGGPTTRQLNKPGNQHQLSISAPFDVLKAKVKNEVEAKQLARNRAIMDKIGKRSDYYYKNNNVDKEKFFPRETQTLFL